MRRRQKNSQNLQTNRRLKEPWLRWWHVISGVAVVISGVLLSAPQIMQNVRALPKEVDDTAGQFLSWVKEDSEWTGYWCSYPEGSVDMEDMQLSDVDMQITIWASEGRIDGTIATKTICTEMPLFNYVLLRGEVFGNTADVVAWDIVQGHEVEFAELTLERDGNIITVTPRSGQTSFFPSVARLGRTPAEVGVEPEPSPSYCTISR